MWDNRAAADVNFNSVISPGDRSGLKSDYVDIINRKLLAPELEALSAGAKVLDFGCGVGRLARWSLFDRLDYTGVDRSQTMIEVAKKQVDKPGRHFSLFDGAVLPFSSDTFDCVIAIWVIQHIVDEDILRTTAGELKRVLKTGGKVILIEQISDHQIDEALPNGEVYKRHRPAAALSALFGGSGGPAWLRKTEGFALHGPFYRSLGLLGMQPARRLRRLVPALIALDEAWYRASSGLRPRSRDWVDQGLMIVKE
jgi:ubiquinone/menaquinone biosynthesis C-methylase UbiE